MNCQCKKEIESRLLEHAKNKYPNAINHNAKLKGYALFIDDAHGMTEKGQMQFEIIADHPLKKGGHKTKKDTATMRFNYCPFCGMAYDEERGAA